MTEKLVSVIIPTYNRGDLITETIESVLAQSYKNIEIIVVDNGSTDDTESVIKKINAGNIRYVKKENSGGPASPRNMGIRMAGGEYIAFLDSDDIWLPDKIGRQVEIFEKMPEVGLVFCQCRFFGEEYHGKTIYPARAHSGRVFDELIRGNFVPTVSVVCRRSVLNGIELFDERPELKAFEDYELWMRIAHGHQFYFISEPLCLLRMHSQNLLGGDNLKSHLGAFRALCSVMNKIGLSAEQLSGSAGHHYLTTAMAWLEVRNFTNFEKCLARSLSMKYGHLAFFISVLRKLTGSRLLFEFYSRYREMKKYYF